MTQEPSVVTLNSKTKNKKICPTPPDLAKTLKTEVDPKIGHEFWRFVRQFVRQLTAVGGSHGQMVQTVVMHCI